MKLFKNKGFIALMMAVVLFLTFVLVVFISQNPQGQSIHAANQVPQNSGQIRVASFNIHDLVEDKSAENISNEVLSNNIEVLCVQEVSNVSEKKEDTKQLLSKLTGFDYHEFFPIPDESGTGLAIYSKYPILNKDVTLLPHDTNYETFDPRILSHVQIKKDENVFNIFNTHLAWYNPDFRKQQMEQIYQITKDLENVVICGDFNIKNFDEISNTFSDFEMANNKKQTFRTFDRYLFPRNWFKAMGNDINKELVTRVLTFKAIDNIIVSDDLSIEKAYMFDTVYSDHNILVVDIKTK